MSRPPTPLPPDMRTDQTANELFLLRMRYKEGRLMEAEANQPFLLDDPASAWIVYAGKADVFAVQLEDGQAAGPRHHLMRLEAGRALFGMHLLPNGIGLVVVGVAETRLLKVRASRLRELIRKPVEASGIADLLNGWIIELSQAMSMALPPKDTSGIERDQTLTLAAGDALSPRRAVVWIKAPMDALEVVGQSLLPTAGETAPEFVPLCKHTWLRAKREVVVEAHLTHQWLRAEAQWASLEAFHQFVLARLLIKLDRALDHEHHFLKQKLHADAGAFATALTQLTDVLNPGLVKPRPDDAQDELLAACQRIGERLGAQFRPVTTRFVGRDLLSDLARGSGLRWRAVALIGAWWRKDNGPLLGYKQAGHQPVALLPTRGGYALIQPETGQLLPLTARLAATLEPRAYMFYRPLPDHALTMRDLVRFVLQESQSELSWLFGMSAASGVLALFLPLITGWLFDQVIPLGDRRQLFFGILALGVSAIAAMLFQLTSYLAQLRSESRTSAALQAAFWSRVLNLPPTFFRQYASGDLAARVFAIETYRHAISGATLTSALSSVFAVTSLGLLFYYDTRLAWLALGLTTLEFSVTVGAAAWQLRYERLALDWEGKVSGRVLQLLNGIAKVRVAGAETRAFALWATDFAAQRTATYHAQGVRNLLETFNAAYPALVTWLIFAYLAWGFADLSPADFLAFNAAFGAWQAASLTLSSLFSSLLTFVPAFERAAPLLKAQPEVDRGKADPGELTGDIDINRLSFRYQPDGPLILNDVSLKIQRGEFVALVGASGSGKSTLFRLLLGFERLASGAIYFDGQELSGLDVRAVRRQIGVVLQSGKLMPGTIFSNIVGGWALSLEDAWEAARAAGIAEDIERLPMGMETIVTEGGGTFSGGQRQRLLIARALISRPRLVLFDEATSALDSQTQAIVSASLARLQATRLVIAHRLSTIVNADHIYVFHDGRIVQHGTYPELINQPGPFADLAKRQLA